MPKTNEKQMLKHIYVGDGVYCFHHKLGCLHDYNSHKKETIDIGDSPDIDTLIDRLTTLRDLYSSEYSNLFIYHEQVEKYGCATNHFYLMGDRLETDEELNERMDYHNKQMEVYRKSELSKLENEKLEYEHLKKKFEGKV